MALATAKCVVCGSPNSVLMRDETISKTGKVDPGDRVTLPLAWASEASLARMRQRAAKPRGAPRSRVLVRLASFAQIGELARRLPYL